ncbi:MAG: hypothetical protein HWE21_13765 [Cytophagia bacterium]|nr:hypothetical protein [Cytophagia bacterium]
MIDLGLLGPENTFHDLARKRFLPQLTFEYFKTFDEIFQAIKSGQVKQALIALRNSHSGAVGENHELIKENGLSLIKEFVLPVNLCLGSLYPNSIESIKKIYSHPMAIKETTEYFSHYSHIKFVASSSTAGAIEELRNSHNKLAGVISSKEALEAQGFLIISEGIQDEAHNSTTFGLITL